MNVKFNVVGFVDRRTDDLKSRYETIEIARRKPITVKPISRPIFNNTRIQDFGTWLETNRLALTDYFNSLMGPEGLGPLGEDDFFIFSRVQHERELDTRDEYKRCYGSKGDQL
jgi:hypothetical protein